MEITDDEILKIEAKIQAHIPLSKEEKEKYDKHFNQIMENFNKNNNIVSPDTLGEEEKKHEDIDKLLKEFGVQI